MVPDSLPERVGRYEVGEKIAEGGMATVHLARLPEGGNRMVALKVLRRELAGDRDYVAMFRDEANLLAKLNHPSTVQLYETGEDQGIHYMAMELLIGQSLLGAWRAFQAHGAKMPYPLSAYICARAAEALHHAHELRDASGAPEHVVHRDVNPSNVFLTLDGRVKVIDFGLARSESRVSRTAVGIIKGKLAYLSPEQVEGHPPDRRADVFALGTTLWEITVDRRLFRLEGDIDTVRAIHACVVPDPRTLVADYPPELWGIVAKALARDLALRYPTAAQLALDLDAWLAYFGHKVEPLTLAKTMAQVSVWTAGM